MIEITKFEMVNKGSLVARFNLKVTKWGGVVIRDCSLFESNGKRWVNMPSRQYEVEGKKKYAPYIFYEDRETNDKFHETVIQAVEEVRNKSAREEQFEGWL